jgi:hypothetical protein
MVEYAAAADGLSYGMFRYVIPSCELSVTLPFVVSYVYKRRMSEKGELRLSRAPVITGHLIAS